MLKGVYYINPINNYSYVPWVVRSYESWAEQCNNDLDCLLKMEYALELEKIYKMNQEEMTTETHIKNLDFLRHLDYELNHVW
ncbi:hypothetical protein D3C77_353200 [compost metagenome]